MKINLEKIKSSIQSIGNSLVVAGLVASVFKEQIDLSIVLTTILFGIFFIIFSSTEKKQ
ncbi:hypothetical protein BHECKSOX_1903 [Bathymodiolus heckerae thiotrophic gill symbiont]|uniref:hypothetical protein n=1 Tax=Bathymodiolus heckerae thiotrophic gill symbiont TaxID=1052212 RepID=UPI0010BAE8ED|nr:hypothetical protein [Bathymodiolus heckerae thiotrophic gill symbiont]SHN92950.1 hypothetical protein BHECKSOX_1903 [Bathymodiolus heckerae thiotrophic gill symbiont]